MKIITPHNNRIIALAKQAAHREMALKYLWENKSMILMVERKAPLLITTLQFH